MPLLLCIFFWLLTALRDPGVVVLPEQTQATPETEALDLSEQKDGRVGQEEEELEEVKGDVEAAPERKLNQKEN